MNDAEAFSCPFCNLAVHVALREGALIHALPMCHEFERMDVESFVRAAIEKARRGQA